MTPEQTRLFALVCEEQRVIHAAVHRSGVEYADLDDAHQLTLLSAWRLICADRLVIASGRDERIAVRGWLKEVTRRCARRSLRRTDQEVELLDDDVLVGVDPVARFEARERLRIVSYRLNREERELLNAVAKGSTLDEIAQQTDTPPGTVATRLRAVRRALRKRVPQ